MKTSKSLAEDCRCRVSIFAAFYGQLISFRNETKRNGTRRYQRFSDAFSVAAAASPLTKFAEYTSFLLVGL